MLTIEKFSLCEKLGLAAYKEVFSIRETADAIGCAVPGNRRSFRRCFLYARNLVADLDHTPVPGQQRRAFSLLHFPSAEPRCEHGRIDLVGVADPEGLQLALSNPQAECLACDAEDSQAFGRRDVTLPDGEPLDDRRLGRFV
jgi:hypothetical protein